jgi:dUTP pyrophosphatase
MEIRFKKLIPEAKTPYKAIDIDAGFDLFATTIDENENFIQYGTGIAVEIPEGYVGLVFPRSSVTKYDLMLKNGVGVIDASYRGEIMCRFTPIINNNIKDIVIDERGFDFMFDENKRYNIGDRVAQIVFMEIPKITLVEAQELSDTERGDGGFGSTGSK